MNSDYSSLESRLSHKSAEVRRRAVVDVATIDPVSGLDLLVQALGDEEWRVRKEAVSVAVKMHLDKCPGLVARLVDEMVQEDKVGLRNAACEALSAMGNDGIEEIVGRMSTFHEGGRKIAIEVLGVSEDPRATDELIARLDDPDWNVRACAAEWLGEKASEKAAGALRDCLESEDRLIVLCALQSLNRMGVSIPWKTLEPLKDQKLFGSELLLALGRCQDAGAAPVIFREIGRDPTAARALELLHNASDAAATAVESVLAGIDEKGTAFLKHLTEQGEPVEQRAAASCLLWTRRLDQLDAIVELSKQESLFQLLVRELRLWGVPAADQLETMLDSAEGRKRASIIGLLTRLLDEETGRSRIKLFATYLDSENMPIATAAASAVARFGNPAVIPRLLELSASDLERVRRSSGHALSELGRRYPDEVRRALEGIEIAGLRGIELCRVIEVIGNSSDTTLLSVMLSSETPRERAAAIRTLASIAGSDAVETIALAMTDEDLRVQMAAASSLGRIGPAAAETIVSALNMAEGPIKAALIRTLGQVGHPEAQEILRGMCKETADVALAALEALCALGLDAEEIQDEILGHPDSEVVKQALSLFGPNVSSRRLEKLLSHSMWDVRLAAVDRLALDLGEEVLIVLTAHMQIESDDLVKRAIGRVISGR